MIQYYNVKQKYTSNKPGSKTRKVTVETISKHLEYITKGHTATYTILF